MRKARKYPFDYYGQVFTTLNLSWKTEWGPSGNLGVICAAILCHAPQLRGYLHRPRRTQPPLRSYCNDDELPACLRSFSRIRYQLLEVPYRSSWRLPYLGRISFHWGLPGRGYVCSVLISLIENSDLFTLSLASFALATSGICFLLFLALLSCNISSILH